MFLYFTAHVSLVFSVKPLEEITESRTSFERLIDQQMNASHNVSHGGNVSYRLAAEVQQENAFNSSAVKLCVRKYVTALLYFNLCFVHKNLTYLTPMV